MQTKYPYVWEMVEMLGLTFPGEPIEYEPVDGTRWNEKWLHLDDWY